MPNDLQSISQGLKAAAADQEAERLKTEAERGEPAIFVADEEALGHGIGWWIDRERQQVYAVRKLSNGYQRREHLALDIELLRKLIAAYDSRP